MSTGSVVEGWIRDRVHQVITGGTWAERLAPDPDVASRFLVRFRHSGLVDLEAEVIGSRKNGSPGRRPVRGARPGLAGLGGPFKLGVAPPLARRMISASRAKGTRSEARL